MASALLVDATDIAAWANRRESQGVLPKLVRRLVHATCQRVDHAGFRAGEGVQLGGWDGIVEVEQGNAFVPNGLSVWELSTEKHARGKADDDYAKRLRDPLGVDPSGATFVFVTARRWKAKDTWAAERDEEGRWSKVRAYDADDLEAWLESASAVHIWLSVALGKHPEGAEDVDSYWDGWSSVTRPAMSPELVLAGREKILERIRSVWAADPSVLTLRGESRPEALAVLAACLRTLAIDKREDLLSRTVIAGDLAAWKRLIASSEQLILIQNFESAETTGPALKKGHTPVVLLGRADSASSNVIEIPRVSREETVKALVAMGVPSDRAGDLAGVARSSLIRLRRMLSVVPEIERPIWARPEHARSLLPALLLGRWSADMEGDRGVLATIAGTTYDAVNTNIVRWSNEDDPPVRCTGTKWHLASEEDAWSLLGRHLTRDDLDGFHNVAIDVLNRPDPSFELPDDRRWMAGVLGKRPRHSNMLRAGIANTLAIIGARGDSIQITGGVTIGGYAGACVRKILENAGWKVWASLPLTLLAEAAPDEFLAAVDRGLAGDRPILLELFREKGDALFSSPAHTQLLFALETLAWSDAYLSRVVIALAKLARIDPGGRWANRPLASLRSIFLLWLPQTRASPEKRLRALDSLRERTPEVAWKVMDALLPKETDHQGPTARPRWRDWAPEGDVRVTRMEYGRAIHDLVARMFDDVGVDGARWSDLIEALPELPRDDCDALIAKLATFANKEIQARDLACVWNALRTLISRYRPRPNSERALLSELIDQLVQTMARLEPTEPLGRFGWLFGNHPELPEGRGEDWRAYELEVASRQREAVQQLYGRRGLAWVSEFVQKVELPDRLGAAIARSDSADKVADDLLNEYLRPDQPRLHSFVSGFIHGKVYVAGLDWAKEKLRTLGLNWSSTKRAAFCVCLPFKSATWEIVEGLDSATAREYWTTVRAFYIEETEVEVASRRLLEHGRPHVAVDLLQHHVRSPNVPATLVCDVLEAVLHCPGNDADQQRLSGHDVSDLLEVVSNSPDVDEARVAMLEWAYLPALGRHQYTPKLLHRELARKPEFFVEVVSLVYRAEDEEPREVTDEEQARGRHAYELLHSWRWRPLPGMPEDGAFDSDGLRKWVTEARECLQANRRLAIGDHAIGEVLSCTPGGDDGVWPHPAVRDLIETLSSEGFEQGLVIGLLNSAGVTTRNMDAGGKPERETAAKFDAWARATSDRWGRTSAMLRSLGAHYQARANDEDQRLELREELLD